MPCPLFSKTKKYLMVIIEKEPGTRTTTTTVATTAEIKKQLRIETDFTDDDDHIDHLTEVAVEMVEDDIRADIRDISNVLEYTIGNEGLQTLYRIRRAPLRTFTKLEYHNGTEWADVAAASYEITNTFTWFEVEIKTNLASAEQLRFTFTTGYTDSKRPKRLKQAVILKAADLYDTERSNYAQGGIMDINTYNRLIAAHKRVTW